MYKNKIKIMTFVFLVIIMLLSFTSCSAPNKISQDKVIVKDTETLSQESAEISSGKYEIITTSGTDNDFCYRKDEDRVYNFNYELGRVVAQAFNPNNGEEVWEWEDDWEKEGYILGVDSELLYIRRKDNRIYAIDINNGKLKWKIMPDVPIRVEGVITNVELACFLGTPSDVADGVIFAVNKENGSVLWNTEYMGSRVVGGILPGDAFFSKTGQTLVVEERGRYKGIDTKTGNLRYETSGDRCCGSYELGGTIDLLDNHFIESHSFITEGGSIGLFNLDSGNVLWKTSRDDIYGILEITQNNIYTGAGGSELVTFDLNTGKEIWSRSNLSFWCNLDSGEEEFLGELENIVILSNPKLSFTWGVDSKNGAIIWENDDLVLDEILGISNNMIIGLNSNKFLFGIDAKTGHRKWRLDLSQRSIGEKTIGDEIYVDHSGIIINNKIVFFDKEGLIFIEPSDGTILQNISSPDIGASYCVFLRKNSMLFIRSDAVSVLKY